MGLMKYKINLISRLSFTIDADTREEATENAQRLAGSEYEVDKQKGERFFFVAYSGINENSPMEYRGNLAFSFMGMPSFIFMTEDLLPRKSVVKLGGIVIMQFYEFKSEADFDEFTTGRDMGEQLGGIIGMN